MPVARRRDVVTRTGVLRFRIDEVPEFVLSGLVLARDPHDVPLVPLYEIGILVDQRLAHPGGVLLIDAEDDRLLEAVAALPQECRDPFRDRLRASVDHQRAVEVPVAVEPILHLLAFAVALPLLRAIALDVPVDVNLDDLVGSEEPVADALLQGVGEDRFAEVRDVGDVPCLLRRGREADLGRRGEVLEDLAPRRIVGRAASVALVDHDQIEELPRELPIGLLVFLRTGDRLVEAEIDLVGRVDAARQLGHRAAERAEVVRHRLVDEHVAVGEKQDPLLSPRLPQAPDDLKGRVRLARARGHDQQDAVLPLGDGLDGRVHGVDLVVARRLAASVLEVVLEDDLLGFGRQPLPCPIALPQIGRRRKGIERQVHLGRRAGPCTIMEYEAVAVRREREGDV